VYGTPFVGVVGPSPACTAEPFSPPVGDSEPEERSGVAGESGREGGVASFVAEAELPGRGEQELKEVFAVVGAKVETTPGDDRPDEPFGVVNVMER
jgi:hypothetical protein